MNEFERHKLLRKISKARELQNWDNLGKLCRKLAELYSEQGRYKDAITWFEEERDAADKHGDKFGVANGNRMIGEMYTEVGQFEKALEFINKYLGYSKSTKDKVEEQRALATLGRTYFCWASEMTNDSDSKTNPDNVLKQCRKAYIKSLFICENELNHVGHKEKSEMKARLLFNLGLVSELQDDIGMAQDYIAKAISICQLVSLYQDLNRCYMAQGMLYLKQEKTQSAIASFDKAYNIAQNLPNKTERSVVALFQKAEIYLLMNNFVGAKNILTKAYKLKSPNENDHSSVQKLLKVALALCKSEDELTKTPSDELNKRKLLYEKLGDGCCGVKNYKQAIYYYLQMLECSEKLGETNGKLLPCYVSLAQTFKDNKQYDLALEYSKKELELSEAVPTEACKTYLNMSEILELKNESYSVISDCVNKAVELAAGSGDGKLYVSALKSLIDVQNNHGKEELAQQTSERLTTIQKEFGISADESSDEEDTPDIGQEIDLENILSDPEHENEEYDRPRTRNPRSLFKIKRNEKGETQLHVAIIKGDINRAKRLVEQGHPVKEQDLNGWTPLHEACNHGHVDMVEFLLNSGADIDDSGGRGCKGITPLHDAASCGHFDIMQLLLDRGASVTALTDDNETVLDCLQEWRKRVQLSSEEEVVFKNLVQKIKNLLESAGHVPVQKKQLLKETTKKSVNLRRTNELEESTSRWRPTSPEFETQLDIGDIELDACSVLSETPDACKQYQSAIDCVRKPKEQRNDTTTTSDNRALLGEEEYIDDWLEDDLGVIEQVVKKRKIVDYLERDRVRTTGNKKSRVQERGREVQASTSSTSDLPVVIPATAETISEDVVISEVVHTQAPESTVLPDIVPNTQVGLTSIQCGLMKIRIKIEDKIFLIPLPNDTNNLTLLWLHDECCKRYYKLEGVEPVIKIKTNDGAILSTDDPLSLVCNEELIGEIISWKSNSLVDRYKEICEKTKSETNKDIFDTELHNLLEISRVTRSLDLVYLSLTSNILSPIFQCLKHNDTLLKLNLSGNVIGDEGMKMLCESLTKMESVNEINLSCNNISDTGFYLLYDVFNKKSFNFLCNFKSLDMSYNCITNSSLSQVDNLVSMLQNLECLRLEFCDLSKDYLFKSTR